MAANFAKLPKRLRRDAADKRSVTRCKRHASRQSAQCPLIVQLRKYRCIAASDVMGHVWTAPALQEESDLSAKRSGAAMYTACFRVEACPVAMRPQWPLALM